MKLTKLQKRYLHRHVCWLCELPLDRNDCGAMGDRCTHEEIEERRARCLAHYKPRPRQR